MKFIITGGEGFIGKALAAKLEREGNEVIVVDRKKGIEAGEYFSMTDIGSVDCVYHLAAQTSVFNDNKDDIIRDNISVFKTVCDACRSSGVKLVYASSSTANDCNTTSLYGISKRFDEEYARHYNPEATGVRFHNVYGPDPRQGSLLWHLLNQDRVRLYNGGRNKRHFTYIDDIVESLRFARLFDGAIMNAANPECMSTHKFALTVSLYKHLEIEPVEEIREFDRVEQVVNDGIFTLPLHYTPVCEGIRRVFESMR